MNKYLFLIIIKLVTSQNQTNNTTPAPTIGIVDCSRWKRPATCYYANIEPIPDMQTSVTYTIQGVVELLDTFYEVYLTPIGYPCVNPLLSILYEPNDHDDSSERIIVTKGNNDLITHCGGVSTACNTFATCLSNYYLGIDQIARDQPSKVVILENPLQSVANCKSYHNWAINVKLTITCSAKTAYPTKDPTKEPTLHPTTSDPSSSPTQVTTTPTNIPSVSPTMVPTAPIITQCGTDRECYYINVSPIPGVAISLTFFAVVYDIYRPALYPSPTIDVYFTPNGYPCTDPSVTVLYERIGMFNSC